jgi:hypothetical protein
MLPDHPDLWVHGRTVHRARETPRHQPSYRRRSSALTELPVDPAVRFLWLDLACKRDLGR